ncbi:hypothetical protein ACOMHN_015537 [Nucella lapillus]
MATEFADDMAGSGQPKAAILLIVGEPFSDSSKQQILEEIVKGLKRWDKEATGVDIDADLAQMAVRADLGEDLTNGERAVHYQSDTTMVTVLISAQAQTVRDSLKVMLTSPCPAKAIVYAGYVVQGTAAWVMQDDMFSSSMFSQAFKDPSVETAIKRMEGGSLMLSTLRGSDWTAALRGSEINRLLKVSVNPAAKTDNGQGLAQFSAYIGNLVRVTPLTSILQASDVIGNISFSRPVLYIFPSHQGDAALFGMKGFNMLVDAGYSRRPCFWDFVRHLDGIDALLLTHLGADNLFGLKALLERKVMDSVHPDIDYMYMNAAKMGSNGVKAREEIGGGSELVISLAAEGSALVDLSRKLGHAPHPLTRPLSSNLEPVNLFHKIGKGSLDMYILNPVSDAKETKEFLSEWAKQAPSFSQANGIPIPNCSSICALLVVRPASSMEKVTRILFPGTAPQHKLLEGLERVKHLEFLKHPTFCSHDHRVKKSASGMTNGRASSVTRRPVSATAARSATRAEPPRHLDTKGASPRTNLTSPATSKASKLQKDSSNKRVSGATKDKGKAKQNGKEKEDKPKSSASSSPSKASIKTISPVKSPSPARTPASTSSEDAPQLAEKSQTAPPKPSGGDKPSAVPPKSDLDQHITPADAPATLSAAPAKVEAMPADNRLAASPDALPEPDHFGSDVDAGRQQPPSMLLNEQAKLRELGVYDNDDDDEGVDNRFDEKDSGGMFGARDFSGEEVQPQALPEPVACLETPTSSEPDMMLDSFAKPSLMEQSQLFENGIEPDYGTEGEVSVTGSQLETTVEKESAGPVAMSEPLEADSSMLTGPSAEPADQYQTLDSAVSDHHTEGSLAEQQAVEDSHMSEHLAEKSAEPPLMTQDLPEDSYPDAEPDMEKSTFIDEPQGEPTSLMQESMVEDSAFPVQSQMGDFASQPSFPPGADVLKQEPEDDHVLAGDMENIPPVSAPKQDDDQGLVCPEYPEEPKEVAPHTDFHGEPEPALHEEIKQVPLEHDLKEDVTSDLSDEEEAEPTPAAAGFDGLGELGPVTGEPQLPARETGLEHPIQYDDYDDAEEDQKLAPTCLGTLQATGPEQPEFSNNLQDFGHDMKEDTSPALREPSPTLQESDVEDNLKEPSSALDEQSFEDSLKESPMTDGPHFHDDLREASSPFQQVHTDLTAASTAPEPSLDDLKEAAPPMEESGFDLKEKKASVEESGLDFNEKDASQPLEKLGFDLKESEMGAPLDLAVKEEDTHQALEEPMFGTEEREASPVTEEERKASPVPKEQDYEREESLAMKEPGFDMEVKGASPALEDPDFEMRETEGHQAFAEQGYELEGKEESPALEKTNVDDVMETGFDTLKEKEATSAMEKAAYDEGKEASPALEEPGYVEREPSPAVEEPAYDVGKDSSPALEELGFDGKETSPPLEEPSVDIGKEASPALEESSFDGKETSPPLEEPCVDVGKDASPALEEPSFDEKEASPPAEEAGYDVEKEASSALEEPGFDVKKASPALEEPGFDVKEASPALEEPGFDVKETSPALEEPGFDVEEASPALEEPGFDVKEASPALEEPGFDVKEASPAPEEPGFDVKEASPALEEPGFDVKEASPALKEPGFDVKEASPPLEKRGFDETEASPALAEPGFDEKEASPALAEPGFDGKDKEESPALEEYKNYDELKGLSAPPPTEAGYGDHVQETPEADFAGKEETSELGEGIAEQSLQYAQAKDHGLEMYSDEEEEEEEEEQVLKAKEEIIKKEDVSELKQDLGARMEEDEELDADDKAQADIMTRQTMEEMDVSDDDGQDEDEETAEAVDSGDNDNDDFVYEKDVNITDEQIAMAGAASKEQIMDPAQQMTADTEAKQDQQISHIPGEDDHLQTHHMPAKEEMPEKEPGQVERRLDESYGMEGDMMDGDRDMQEIMAMHQTHHQADLAQEEDSDLDSQDPEPREDRGLNPFEEPLADTFPKSAQPYSYEDEEDDHRAAAGDFDPLAQWGPPTGLPAPAVHLDDVDAIPEAVADSKSLSPNDFVSCHSVLGEQGEAVNDQDKSLDRSETLAEGDFTGSSSHFEKGMPASDRSSEVDAAEFDPLAEWGQPMGLPAPAPPEASKKNLSAKKGAGDTKKTDTKKPATSPTKAKTGSEKRPTSATKSTPKAMNGTTETPKSARSKPEAKKGFSDTLCNSRPASGKSLDTSRNNTKTRTTPTSRRPASATRSRVSPEVFKMPPLPPFTPFYMDLTYIPNHGDTAYVDSEFFKRVRARYYVLSSRNPNPKILEMLMEAKESWGKADQEVTVIPTYETQILQHWMAVHKEKLSENKIDIAPAASRCTVRLQDHEDSCYTYRLEF